MVHVSVTSGLVGAYLLACYDEDDDQYQSVCKVGTGFGDSDLATLYDTLKKTVIPEPKNYYCVSDSFKPDVWFEPTMVFEVKCADLSISPNHKVCACVDVCAWVLVVQKTHTVD